MTSFKHLRVTRDEQSIVTVEINLADRSMNVFDGELLREMDQFVSSMEQDTSARLIVFRSSKPSGFIAGADVHRIAAIESAEEADNILKYGQDLFNRVAALDTPTVAVIHGPCLGGGLEFAMACRFRIARNDRATQLGLPETQLGLLPAWGGTQRLPLLVGLSSTLGMILQGSSVSADRALKLGLVDRIVDPDEYEEKLSQAIVDLAEDPGQSDSPRTWGEWLRDGNFLSRKVVFELTRKNIATKSKHYPALLAAVRAVETGLYSGMKAGLEQERQEFCELLNSHTTRNLLNLFLRREESRRKETWVTAPDLTDAGSIETIGVLGAGTMGAGIAQLAATRGYDVILKDVDDHLVQRGMARIQELTEKGVEKKALDIETAKRALERISISTETNVLKSADLIIEAIVERLDIKQTVFQELDELLPEEVLFASNTSALPVSGMAEVTHREDRFAGLHFFNPVHKMPLVEIVRTSKTSDETVATLVDVVRKLGKTPIVVAEGPGFLVNRVLFPYLDEAVRMVSEGVSIIDIDKAATEFGMPMGPLELLDTIGIDVANHVAGTLTPDDVDNSPTRAMLQEMVSTAYLGKKSGRGFYLYKANVNVGTVDIPAEPGSVPKLPESIEIGGETITGIQQRLIFAMIQEAMKCMDERIVSQPWMADLGMVLGTGFAPFRGGPLTLAEHWGHDEVMRQLTRLSEICGPRFTPTTRYLTHHLQRDNTNEMNSNKSRNSKTESKAECGASDATAVSTPVA